MKRVLVILGIILILVQIVNYCGVSRMRVKLFPDNNDLLPLDRYVEDNSGFNLKKLLFAFEAGTDRFSSGFEDLTFPKNEYRVMSAKQVASTYVRESLDCSSGGSVGLFLYDTILVISYSLVGLLGMLLIVIAIVKEFD